MENVWIVAAITALFTSFMTTIGFYLVFKKVVKPELDRKLEEVNAIASTLEQRIGRGVQQGLKESIKAIPTATMKETTRSVVRMGADFVDNGLSNLFKEK